MNPDDEGDQNTRAVDLTELIVGLKQAQEGLRSALDRWQEAVREFQRRHREQLELLQQRIRQSHVLWKRDLETVQPYLARSGWYLHARVPLQCVGHIAEMLADGEHEAIEDYMQSLARETADTVIKNAMEEWPQRRAFLLDALEAHHAGKYTLSIPVFLAQADGIAETFFGDRIGFFAKSKAGPKIGAAYKRMIGADDKDSVVALAFYRPLDILSSLAYDYRDWRDEVSRDPTFGPLNRAGVMHGLDLIYPTEANSLRAIMVLGYLTDVLNWLAERGSQSDSAP